MFVFNGLGKCAEKDSLSKIMTSRQLSQLLSAVDAYCLEVDRMTDYFFDQRRFVEDLTAEKILGFECEEQQESEIKVERMAHNLQKILEFQKQVPNEVGTRNQLPISKGFLDQTKAFDNL